MSCDLSLQDIFLFRFLGWTFSKKFLKCPAHIVWQCSLFLLAIRIKSAAYIVWQCSKLFGISASNYMIIFSLHFCTLVYLFCDVHWLDITFSFVKKLYWNFTAFLLWKIKNPSTFLCWNFIYFLDFDYAYV